MLEVRGIWPDDGNLYGGGDGDSSNLYGDGGSNGIWLDGGKVGDGGTTI